MIITIDTQERIIFIDKNVRLQDLRDIFGHKEEFLSYNIESFIPFPILPPEDNQNLIR